MLSWKKKDSVTAFVSPSSMLSKNCPSSPPRSLETEASGTFPACFQTVSLGLLALGVSQRRECLSWLTYFSDSLSLHLYISVMVLPHSRQSFPSRRILYHEVREVKLKGRCSQLQGRSLRSQRQRRSLRRSNGHITCCFCLEGGREGASSGMGLHSCLMGSPSTEGPVAVSVASSPFPRYGVKVLTHIGLDYGMQTPPGGK